MALNYCFLTRNRQRRKKNAGGPQHGRKTLSRSLKRTKLHFAQGFPMEDGKYLPPLSLGEQIKPQDTVLP